MLLFELVVILMILYRLASIVYYSTNSSQIIFIIRFMLPRFAIA